MRYPRPSESQSTIHGWLLRLDGDTGRRYDRKSPGRPCRLSDPQRSSLDEALEKSPEESGFQRGNWTAKLVSCHILNTFNVRYSADGALRLTARLNFSVRKTRPAPYNSATVQEQEEYVKNTVREIETYVQKRYKVVCLDAAALVDSPASSRGIRRRGGCDEIKINYSKKSIKIIGALGEDTLDVQFHEKLGTKNVIALLEEIRQKYGRVFVIMDNAATHKSKDMDEFIEKANGAVVRWFLPPHTPQHNPIEVQWREIKRAIADTFFGGFDRLEKRIRKMLNDGEVARVKLFKYILDAIKIRESPDAVSAPERPPDGLTVPLST